MSDTLQDKPNSQSWRQFLLVALCMVGAFYAKTLIHWSCLAIAAALQPTTTESIPNTTSEKDSRNR